MSAQSQPRPVRRLSSPSELVRSEREPVVLEGAAAHWPAIATWTPSSFRERYGSVPVGCAVDLPHGIEGGLPYRLRRERHHRTMPLAELVTLVEASSVARPCYLNQAGLELFPGLAEEIALSDLYPFSCLVPTITSVWLGSEGTRSGFHVDFLDNFVVQVYGRKRVLLAPPEEAPRLYPFADVPSKSRVDPERPDLRRFPAYRRCRLYQATLAPGDVLFLPRLHWHYFRSLSTAISISHWFGPAASANEQSRLHRALGSWFQAKSSFVNAIHLLGALVGVERRRLFAPCSKGCLEGRKLRSRILERRQTNVSPSSQPTRV